MLQKFASRVIKIVNQSLYNANKIFNRACRRKNISKKYLMKSMQKKKIDKQRNRDENM